jgi:hypothetical protein
VGADNAFTSCDLRILVEEAARTVASPDADVVVGRRDVSPAVGWLLAEGPVRPVGVVVIDVFAERVVQMLCVPITSSTSCHQAIFVDRAADLTLSSDAVQVEVDRLG